MGHRVKLGMFEHPVVREFCELLLVQADIEHAVQAFRLWDAKSGGSNSPDAETEVIIDSLFRDCIVQFVGCFDNTTNDYPLVVEEVYKDWPDIALTFRYLRGMRNSFAAHRYGASRNCIAIIHSNSETGEFLGWQTIQVSYQGPDAGDRPKLLKIIEAALSHVEERIKQLDIEVADLMRSLPAAQRLALPEPEMHLPGPREMKLSRDQIVDHRKNPETLRQPGSGAVLSLSIHSRDAKPK